MKYILIFLGFFYTEGSRAVLSTTREKPFMQPWVVVMHVKGSHIPSLIILYRCVDYARLVELKESRLS